MPTPRAELPTARISAPVLLHIGYHKTATTYLQRSLFADSSNGFSLLGRRPGARFETRPFVVWPSALEFAPQPFVERYGADVAKAAASGRIPVFSDERYSGNPFSGGYDSKEIAHRLRAIFEDPKILLVIREQRSMLYSTYDEYVREGGTSSVADFLEPATRHAIPPFRLSYFEYHRLIDLYQKLFGAGNVLVLAYEQFRDTPDTFTRLLAEFAGADAPERRAEPKERVNAGRGAAWIELQRRSNLFLRSDDLNARSPLAVPGLYRRLKRAVDAPPRCIPGAINRRLERRIRSHIEQKVEGYYTNSNRQTLEATGLALDDLGYQI